MGASWNREDKVGVVGRITGEEEGWVLVKGRRFGCKRSLSFTT